MKIVTKPQSARFTRCLILSLLVFFSIASCNDKEKGNKVYLKTEMPRIEKTIHDAIGWARNKNYELLYSIIAEDSNYLEVDPGSQIIRGIDQFRENEPFWNDPGFKAIRYEIRDLKISFSQSGTVAWFYCMLDDINEYKGKEASWINTRWTGVLEKRKEKWVIVQMHFSFANE